ncbi:MAG: rhomboid family intramembrane serine protease, partial [Planctomycetes bacterium]|nr:rhomboid family intramembrane serine protease [Planctomycetota bacterium]
MATAEAVPSPPRPAKPILTLALLLACGGGFAASYLFGEGLDEATLIACGASSRALVVGSRQWWRLASAGFLHSDLLHLLINLYAIFALGRSVEGLWGHRRFLAVYAAALVCGNAAALAETQGTTVGATGAVFGLLGALGTLLVRHRDILTRPARIRLLIGLGIVLALNIVLGIALPSIGNAEVVGGLAAGAVAAVVLRPARALGKAGAFGEAFASLASAAAALGIIGSLTMAARHARASEWRSLIGGELETHLLRGEELTVSVPKGWRYTPASGRGGRHSFERPGLASVTIYLLPEAGPLDAAAVASRVQQEWPKTGAKLVAKRELAIGDQTGIEMHFRLTAHNEVQRQRVVIFPTRIGRIVSVNFTC